MSGLPAGLTEPLHLLEPFPWWKVWLAAAVLVLAALWLWRRLRQPAPAPKPVPKPPVYRPRSVGNRILEILERYRDRDPRQGFHSLAELGRSHLEELTGDPYSLWTAGEIARRRGDDPLAEWFDRLARHRFGRAEPRGVDLSRVAKAGARLLEGPAAVVQPTRSGRARGNRR